MRRTITLKGLRKTTEAGNPASKGIDYEQEVRNLNKVRDSSKKKPLNVLVANFRKIFPVSEYSILKVGELEVKGYDTLSLNIKTQVMSSTKKHGYTNIIVLRRDFLDQPWNLKMKAEVKCSCPAFRYYVAHPDLRTRNLAGRPTQWNKVKNKVKNPELYPGICKHLMKSILKAINNNIIKR